MLSLILNLIQIFVAERREQGVALLDKLDIERNRNVRKIIFFRCVRWDQSLKPRGRQRQHDCVESVEPSPTVELGPDDEVPSSFITRGLTSGTSGMSWPTSRLLPPGSSLKLLVEPG